MSNSIILQVDESTKGLMEEIQSGISSSIEDGMREVKDKVESVDDTLRKFKNFDSISSSVEQLRSLAEESKKFTAIVSPLESSVSELKQGNKTQEQALSQVTAHVDLLVKGVAELGEKENNLALDIKSKIQNVLDSAEKRNTDTKNFLNEVLQTLSQAENARHEISDKINSSLSSIKDLIGELSQHLNDKTSKIESDIHKITKSHTDFSIKYTENESGHQAFENKTSSQIEDINKSMEKIQATLDIIVNLVTPFWKKW